MPKIESIDKLFDWDKLNNDLSFFISGWADAFFSLITNPQIKSEAYKEYFKKKILDLKKQDIIIDSPSVQYECVPYLSICIAAAEILGNDIAYSYFLRIPEEEKSAALVLTFVFYNSEFTLYRKPLTAKQDFIIKILRVIAFFIKKHYEKLPAEKKLKIKYYGPVGNNAFKRTAFGKGDFLLALLTIDATVLEKMPRAKKKYILLSCQYFDLTSDVLINYIINLYDEDESLINTPFTTEKTKGAYYSSLAIVWSWLGYKSGLRQIDTSYKNHSFTWKKCFSPGGRTKWNPHPATNISWYAVARNIRIFKGDIKAGLVPNIPEVKAFLNDKIPPSLDLRKKDKYMRMMGFRPLPVPFVEYKEEGKLQRRFNDFFLHIVKTYLDRYGPLHLQLGSNWCAAILGANLPRRTVIIDDEGEINFSIFLNNWLHYPDFLTSELSQQIAQYNRDAYWHSLRFLLEPITDPLARRKRSLPIPKTYKSKTPEPYFYSPIYYFRGNKP